MLIKINFILFLREMEFNRLLSSAISKYGSTNDQETKDIEKN